MNDDFPPDSIDLYPGRQFDHIRLLLGRLVRLESPMTTLAIGTVVGCDFDFIYLNGGIQVSMTKNASWYLRVIFLDVIRTKTYHSTHASRNTTIPRSEKATPG